ncbi:MAG: hypothetical protein WC565_06690, partial [Parcubacteria group bacterium]
KVEQELLESMEGPSQTVKTAARIAARWFVYSTCQPVETMARFPKTSVYWGIAPPEVEPYPDWDPEPKDPITRLAQGSPCIPGMTEHSTTGETPMSFPKQQADATLLRLDKLAHTIQANHERWGMPFEQAKAIVNDIDKTADEIEVAAYGAESLQRRQVEVLKQAKVIQRDADESYMDTFANPMAPKQVEADEPYMKLYGDDQSSAVNDGKSSVGRPLAP